MVTNVKNGKKGSKKRSKAFAQAILGKPSGVIQPRVQQVGPEHFGIISVDCAKDRSKWMLCDFYGQVLVPPTPVEHRRTELQLTVRLIRKTFETAGIQDSIACVEMTGTYHQIVERTFKDAGFDTRLVHPFASSHYRPPEHGDLKTDDHDLVAVFRAAVNGFGLLEHPWTPRDRSLQLLVRHRRDLVDKRSKLQCQIRQALERCLPGYSGLFPDSDLWVHPVGLRVLQFIATHGGTHQALLDAGIPGVSKWLKEQSCGFQSRSVERILAWAANAATGDPLAPVLTRIWQTLLDDWRAKTQQIQTLERELAGLLVQTPWILLLSHPGINVVSAAELAGEMGPIEHYASPKAITGRAGLFPSRYQSDQVDRGGKLSRFRNAKLRAAWLLVATNLIKCNAYWRGKYNRWKEQKYDPRDLRCRVANRLTRSIFSMISGRRIYQHPSRLDRSYVLNNILEFHRQHGSPMTTILADMQAATEQLPQSAHAAEAQPLAALQLKASRSRHAEPQALGELLVHVLARLGMTSPTPPINLNTLEAPVAELRVSDR